MKKIVTGILAHVDAGKTTLSESLLYTTGEIKNLGRVDKGNTMLDTDEMEKQRGITIYTKHAHFQYKDMYVSMIDTPGHADFSAEMERALSVLDYAILVISAVDNVQSHTKTLWRLFREYNIPVFLFVNKMDQQDIDKLEFLQKLKKELSDNCIDFTNLEEAYEDIALATEAEEVVDAYMNEGLVEDGVIIDSIRQRKLFPIYFGSALKLYGINDFLDGFYRFTKTSFNSDFVNADIIHSDVINFDNTMKVNSSNSTTEETKNEFGARVFRITTDKNGNRLTHIKITSGQLATKMLVDEEKINEIRIYNGEKYETVPSIDAGMVCAVTGLSKAKAGDGLGCEKNNHLHLLEPVLSYTLFVPKEISSRKFYGDLKAMEDEMPELSLEWDEKHEEIHVKLMGKIQIEILTALIKKKFNFVPEFGMGSISYKETIKNTVIGVGHFEPLRHYAEVHILMEPLELGAGLQFDTDVSEDILDKNWQRLIMTHLKEKNHLGVLSGSTLTDVKFTIINGRAHQKHTEGGDFRQATYRAIRQGLMQAENVLLEPYYNFQLEIPSNMVGRAMTDIERMFGTMEISEQNDEFAVITGYGPVSTMRDYQADVSAYTSGKGSMSVSFHGYKPCHNQEEVLEQIYYDPENDLKNPSSSVFCAHGAGFIVPWYEVFDYMHVSDAFSEEYTTEIVKPVKREAFDYSIGLDEIDEILERNSNANASQKKRTYKKHSAAFDYYNNGTSFSKAKSNHLSIKKKKYLIVDGYNVIFAWEELKKLAEDNIDGAKGRFIQILSNYQGILDDEIILVFDGYKKKGNLGSTQILEQIKVVHTKEGETADSYIERFASDHKEDANITVVSSDGLIQTTVRSLNGFIVSSREFLENMNRDLKEMLE